MIELWPSEKKLTQIIGMHLYSSDTNEDIERASEQANERTEWMNEKTNTMRANRRKHKILHDHLISINTRGAQNSNECPVILSSLNDLDVNLLK